MMNQKVLAVLFLAILVLLIGRAARHDTPAPVGASLPVSSGGWTAARSGDVVTETGFYRGLQLVMTATRGADEVALDISGDPARLPDDDQVEFHGTFDDHASFAFVGDGSGGGLQSGIDAALMPDWLRHMAAGGSLVISFDNQAAAPIVFPLAGAGASLRAWAAATRLAAPGGLPGLHGPAAAATFLGFSVITIFAFLAVIYLLPAVLAYARHSTQAGLILVFNILLGWTIIGWWVLLLVALLSPTWNAPRRS